ncbi:MAG: EamA family transporter RarD [Marinibacterium sp.]
MTDGGNLVDDTPAGLAFAVSAYLIWGLLPLYLKAMSHMGAAEIVAHRIVWSVPLAGLVLVLLGRGAEIRTALCQPRLIAMGALTASLVTINWGIYVWAVAHDRAVEAALGYYINPLFSVFLGAVLLKERLDGLQRAAVALAALAVLYLTIAAGRVPAISLGLAVSWGLYGFFKKRLPVGPNLGFLLEVTILSGPALAYLLWLGGRGAGHFGAAAPDTALLAAAGLATATPLMLFANGAKRLPLSTIGILQYITPTLILLIAVAGFGEPLGPARAVALPMIWAALGLYSISLLRAKRA